MLGAAGDAAAEPRALAATLFPHALLGLLLGLLGAAFTQAVVWVSSWRQRPEVVRRTGTGRRTYHHKPLSSELGPSHTRLP